MPQRTTPPVSEKGLIVLLDPGHGGQDSGCIWQDQTNGTLYMEKDINLDVCARVLSHLSSSVGARMTRLKDEQVGLYNRAIVPFAYDLLLSIHCNAVPAEKYDVEKVAGTEVYVRSLSDTVAVDIAKQFVEPVAAALGITPNEPNAIRSNNNLRVLTLADRCQDRFGRSMSCLRRAPGDSSRGERGHGAAALILELGYLTNSRDRAALIDPLKREAVAKAIAKVINRLVPMKALYDPNEKPEAAEKPEQTAETAPLPDAAYIVETPLPIVQEKKRGRPRKDASTADTDLNE